MRVCIGVGCWGWCEVLYHPALWAPLLPGGGELEMALLDMGDGLRRWFKEMVERGGLKRRLAYSESTASTSTSSPNTSLP